MTNPQALYIHIPFCDHICTYCDFYKMVAKSTIKDKYIDYLIKEIEMKKDYLNNLKSIYIGGGTPSSLTINQLEKLLKKINEIVNYPINEYTIEANPLDITDEFCDLLTKYHLNRLSLGVQSLNQNKLKFLGRNHNKSDVNKAIDILHKHNIYNINCDLIFGCLNENFSIIKNDLKFLIKKKIPHFSTYSLILEEKTILYHNFQKKQFKLINEDKERKIYYKIIKYLTDKGFKQYEVSNFALKGHGSIHNLTYWNNEEYCGCGAGASYYLDSIRYTNITNLYQYFLGIDNNDLIYNEKIQIKEEDKIKEEIMLGLRKTQGISLSTFKEKYHQDIRNIYPFIDDLIKQKVLVLDNDYLYIPINKFYVMNDILIKFM